MQSITIKIKTTNAAFRSGLDTPEDQAEWDGDACRDEVRRILEHAVTERLSADLFETGGEVALFDVNGASVGSIVVK